MNITSVFITGDTHGAVSSRVGLWEIMNWLICEHWQVWREPIYEGSYRDWWRIYNKVTRKV